jgi:hypothetical protein
MLFLLAQLKYMIAMMRDYLLHKIEMAGKAASHS